MRSFDATQTALVAANSKRLTWLFTVTTLAPTTYRWSTKSVSYGGNSYAFKVIPDSFSGVTLRRPITELGILAPSTLFFSVSNADGTLTASDFVGAKVQVDLVLSNWTTETVCASWRFRCIRCEAAYYQLNFTCEDFVQQYLQGEYPNTPLVRDLVPNMEREPQDTLCVPIVFGEGYIPIRSVYMESIGARRYVLGLANDMVAASGTLTSGNARLSLIDGAAFIWANGVDLSAYAGVDGTSTPYMIQVTDSAGKSAWGYLGAQGSGVTYGSNLCLNGEFETDLSGWGWANGTISRVSGGYSGTYCLELNDTATGAHGFAYYSRSLTGVRRALLELDFRAKRGAHTTGWKAWLADYDTWASVTSVPTGSSTSWTAATAYGTQIGDGWHIIYHSQDPVGATGTLLLDAVRVRQVVEGPATNSLHIVSTPNGSTRNWTYIEPGFAPGVSHSSVTYRIYAAIKALRSPTDWPAKSEWRTMGALLPEVVTIDSQNYVVLNPLIADSDGDGTLDATGLWQSGGRLLDPHCQYAQYVRRTMVSPADVIAYVLQDMGVPSVDIDTGAGSSFEAAATTYASWSLGWYGGLYARESRQAVLAKLLRQCHSILVVQDKIKLVPLSKTSRATLDSSDILRTGGGGGGSLRYDGITPSISDSGYVSHPYHNYATQPEAELYKVLVEADSTKAQPSDEVLALPWILSRSRAVALGKLYYGRALSRMAQVSMDVKLSTLALEPGDAITIDGPLYDGTYVVVIDSVTIHRQGRISITATRHSVSLKDWSDVYTPLLGSYLDDSVTTAYAPVVAGPDSNIEGDADPPNRLRGKVLMDDDGTIVVGQGGDIILKGGTDDNPSLLVLEDDGGGSFQAGGEIWFAHAADYNEHFKVTCYYNSSPEYMTLSIGPNPGAFGDSGEPDSHIVLGYDASAGAGTNLVNCADDIKIVGKDTVSIGAANSGVSSVQYGLVLEDALITIGNTNYVRDIALQGNVGIGTSVFGTDAAKVLCIKNGTAPSTSPADSVQLYAEDVSSSSELKVRDEAGNINTLSPHNFSLFDPAADDPYPWSYYAENSYLGERVNVDMSGAIRAIEELTGKKFIYREKFTPIGEWGQAKREARIAEWIKAHTYEVEVDVKDALIPPEPDPIPEPVGPAYDPETLDPIEPPASVPPPPWQEIVTGYRLDTDTGTVRPKIALRRIYNGNEETLVKYRKTKKGILKPIIKRRKLEAEKKKAFTLKPDHRFDDKTGRIYRTVKPSRDDAFDVLKTQLNAIKCPPWLAARLNRTKEE